MAGRQVEDVAGLLGPSDEPLLQRHLPAAEARGFFRDALQLERVGQAQAVDLALGHVLGAVDDVFHPAGAAQAGAAQVGAAQVGAAQVGAVQNRDVQPAPDPVPRAGRLACAACSCGPALQGHPFPDAAGRHPCQRGVEAVGHRFRQARSAGGEHLEQEAAEQCGAVGAGRQEVLVAHPQDAELIRGQDEVGAGCGLEHRLEADLGGGWGAGVCRVAGGRRGGRAGRFRRRLGHHGEAASAGNGRDDEARGGREAAEPYLGREAGPARPRGRHEGRPARRVLVGHPGGQGLADGGGGRARARGAEDGAEGGVCLLDPALGVHPGEADRRMGEDAVQRGRRRLAGWPGRGHFSPHRRHGRGAAWPRLPPPSRARERPAPTCWAGVPAMARDSRAMALPPSLHHTRR